MATNYERLINNCLQHIPETDPFNCELLLYKVKDKAFNGIPHQHLFQQSSTIIEHAKKMKTYLLAHKYAMPYDNNQIQLTEEGRKLREIGEIREYKNANWWDANWKKYTTIISILIAVAALVFRAVWHR